MTSEHQRGYWEAKLLFHSTEASRHTTEANSAREWLKVFHPNSHLISGGKDGSQTNGR